MAESRPYSIATMKRMFFNLALVAGYAIPVIPGWADNYAIVYDDASIQTGEAIHNSYAWSHLTNATTIGEAPLLQDSKAIRYIREYHRDVQLIGPYVRMANGDVLPGVPAGLLPADEERGLDKRLQVQVSPPCMGFHANDRAVSVRTDRVAAIVSDPSKEANLAPGTLELKDGTQITVKSLRWGEDGLKLLTAEGVKRVSYAALDSYKARKVDTWTALQEDASVTSPDPHDRLVQIRLVNGAVLTAKRMLLIEVDRNVIGIQPAWAYSGIRFDTRQHVVSRTYRALNEVPLSLFPVTSLKQQSATGFQWSWSRDRNLRGDELGCKELRAGFGLATHSYSELAVELPPDADRFTSWVGIDRAVGKGGCVKCAVYGDEMGGTPLWQSGFIRGGEAPQRIPPIDVSSFKRLVFVTDFGQDGRPAGADPLDIRDELDWLNPTITLKRVPKVETPKRYARIYEQLREWQGAEAWSKETLTGPCVLRWWRLYSEGLYLDIQEEFRLKRTLTVSPTNAWLHVRATRARQGVGGHVISLHVNGRLHEPRGWIARENNVFVRKWLNLETETKTAGSLGAMDWDLGRYLGQEVTLELVLQPAKKPGFPLPYLVLENIQFRPAIYAVNDAYVAPVIPEINLESIPPQATELVMEGATLQPGKDVTGQPLQVYHFPYATGLGVPAGSSLSYTLDPAWKRFVAVVGYTGINWKEVGPYQVFFDDESSWVSSSPIRFGWWSRGTQVDIPIPPGSKTMTLKIAPGEAHGAWAQSGFMTQAKPPAAGDPLSEP